MQNTINIFFSHSLSISANSIFTCHVIFGLIENDNIIFLLTQQPFCFAFFVISAPLCRFVSLPLRFHVARKKEKPNIFESKIELRNKISADLCFDNVNIVVFHHHQITATKSTKKTFVFCAKIDFDWIVNCLNRTHCHWTSASFDMKQVRDLWPMTSTSNNSCNLKKLQIRKNERQRVIRLSAQIQC